VHLHHRQGSHSRVFSKNTKSPGCGVQSKQQATRARAPRLDLPVVGNRPGLGVHVHQLWGGITAHLAKVHVHTPPRPRVMGGGSRHTWPRCTCTPRRGLASWGGGVTTHLATVMAHLGAHGTTMTHFGLGTPRPWHIGAHDTPMAHLGPGTARPWRTSELAHLDHGTPRTWHTSDLAHLGAHGTTMAHLGLGTPRTWHTSDLAHLGLGTPRTWHTSTLAHLLKGAHLDHDTPPEGATRHTSATIHLLKGTGFGHDTPRSHDTPPERATPWPRYPS